MGGLSNLATVGLNLALQQQAYQRAAARISREERARRQELLARLAERERQIDALLRERLARERARAGAAGVAHGASFDAILQALRNEAEESKRAARMEVADALTLLRARAARARRRNLLETSDRLLGSFVSGLRRLPGFRRDLLT